MSTATMQQVVTFRLGEDQFAVDIYAVERVLRFAKPTLLPNLPPWLEGVIEYHGRVVPVIDLRARFGLERIAPRMETRIIVFHVGEEWIGAIVDQVLEVVTVQSDQVASPPAMFRGLSADYLRGLVRRNERLIIFLEVQQLLTATERMELRRAAEAKRDG